MRPLHVYAASVVISAVSLFALNAGAEENIPIKTVDGYVMVEGVNARNGNLSVTFATFEVDDGVPYRRTYNSLSDNRGTFGRGWGSVFDTRLIVLDDGRVVVRENGNGAIAVYGAPRAGETDEALERKVIAAEAAPRPSGADLPVGEGLSIDASKVLAMQVCDDAYISRHPDSWVRRSCLSGTQVFDLKGRLIEYRQGGHTVTIKRRFGKIRRVSTPFDQSLHFRYLWKRLWVKSPKGGWYSYRFDKNRYNTQSDSPKSGPLTYAYDQNKRLIQIGYVDSTHVDINYDAQGRVSRRTDRLGNTVSFEYLTTEYGQQETLVTTRTSKQTSKIRYHFLGTAAVDPLGDSEVQ